MTAVAPTRTRFEALSARTIGVVLQPGDAGFATAATGWQLAHAQKPLAVLIAQGADDVQAAVQFAAQHDLPLAVQATGHGFVRAAEDALLINVAQMNSVQIDPVARTATLEPGANWDAVLEAARPHGLTGLVGDTPSVGVTGYTLGGGSGWFARKYGLSCDSLIRADIITMDGVLRTASATENPELFWGLRGGTGGLGVVTSITIQLYAEASVSAAQIVFPFEAAATVARAYRDWARTAPEALTSRIVVMRGPDAEFLPPFLRERTALIVQAVYSGDAAAARAALEPMLGLPGAIAQVVQELPPAELGRFFNAPAAPMEGYGRAEQLAALTDEAINEVLGFAAQCTAPFFMLELRHLGGATRRGSEATSAFSHRAAEFLLNFHTISFHPAVREVSQLEVERFKQQLGGLAAGGVMPNFLMGDEGLRREQQAYTVANHARLAMLKLRFDPENRLRFARTPGSRPL